MHGDDYLFALLTGYEEEQPEGAPPLREGLFFNPYMPGQAIGMPPPLMSESVEYPDGTPATVSQVCQCHLMLIDLYILLVYICL